MCQVAVIHLRDRVRLPVEAGVILRIPAADRPAEAIRAAEATHATEAILGAEVIHEVPVTLEAVAAAMTAGITRAAGAGVYLLLAAAEAEVSAAREVDARRCYLSLSLQVVYHCQNGQDGWSRMNMFSVNDSSYHIRT